MRFYLKIGAYIFLSILGLLIFRLFFNIPSLIDDIDSFGGFLQILGTLYGIMAAFIIFVVWSRYDDIKEIAERETDSLSELYALATYLEDEEITKKVKAAIRAYAEAVIKRGWKKLAQGEKSKKADKALNLVYQAIKSIKSERRRFPVIFGQMVEKFEDVSDLRTRRVALSREHLPASLKTLLIFDSLALIFSVYLLPITNIWLSIFITLITTGTVALTIRVIFDLDNPLQPGEWTFTPQPFKDLLEELKERK